MTDTGTPRPANWEPGPCPDCGEHPDIWSPDGHLATIRCTELAALRAERDADRLSPSRTRQRDNLVRLLNDRTAERDALRARAERAEALVAELVDEGECWFDHHGNCQEHYVFGDNVTCPHKAAKALLKTLREAHTP